MSYLFSLSTPYIIIYFKDAGQKFLYIFFNSPSKSYVVIWLGFHISPYHNYIWGEYKMGWNCALSVKPLRRFITDISGVGEAKISTVFRQTEHINQRSDKTARSRR